MIKYIKLKEEKQDFNKCSWNDLTRKAFNYFCCKTRDSEAMSREFELKDDQIRCSFTYILRYE